MTIRDAEFGASAPAVSATEPISAPRPSNWAVAGAVVAVMLLMATIGLAFALHTTAFRRANDSKGAQPPEPAIDERPIPPAEWAGLGYIADDVQALAGVRMADALATPAGRALLKSFGVTDAGQTKLFGVKPSAIDHLLIGASLRALPPRVTAVVRVRGTMGDVRLDGAGHTVEQHGKSLVRGKLWPNGPEGVVWRPDRRTLVAALLPEDFDRIPASPRAVVPLSDLSARLDPTALAWSVATLDTNNAALALLAGHLPSAERDSWAKLEKVAIGLTSDGTRLTLSADIHCRDGGAADALSKAVMDSLAKAGFSVTGPTTVGAPSGNWRHFSATADGQRLSVWLAGLRGR